MSVGSVGASAYDEDNSEPTDLETGSTIAKPLKGSPQNDPNDSGVEKSARGFGSASLLEALKFRQAQLAVPAALRGNYGQPLEWTVPATDRNFNIMFWWFKSSPSEQALSQENAAVHNPSVLSTRSHLVFFCPSGFWNTFVCV